MSKYNEFCFILGHSYILLFYGNMLYITFRNRDLSKYINISNMLDLFKCYGPIFFES